MVDHLHGRIWSDFPSALSPPGLAGSVVWTDTAGRDIVGSCGHKALAVPGTVLLAGRRYVRTREPVASKLVRVQAVVSVAGPSSNHEIIDMFTRFTGAVGGGGIFYTPSQRCAKVTLAGLWGNPKHRVTASGGAVERLPVAMGDLTWLLTMDDDGSRLAASAVAVVTAGFGAGGEDPSEPPTMAVAGGEGAPVAAVLLRPGPVPWLPEHGAFASLCNRETAKGQTTRLLAFKVSAPCERPVTPMDVDRCLAACPDGSCLLGRHPAPVTTLDCPHGWSAVAGIGTLISTGWVRRRRLVMWRFASGSTV